MLLQARKAVGLGLRSFMTKPRSPFLVTKAGTSGFHTSPRSNAGNPESFEDMKQHLHDIFNGEKGLARKIEHKSIFCNNRINLGEIKVYGFDYDYTLARYTDKLNDVIYKEALNNLVQRFNYPKELLEMKKKLEPNDVIRGLHFDTKTGHLMKINAYQNILRYTVFRGLTKVDDVEKHYDGLHIKNDEIIPSKDNFGRPRMRQMVDIFSNSEAAALGTVVEFFAINKYEIDNELLFRDCQDAIKHVHTSGTMSSIVEKNFECYLKKNDELKEYLLKLRDNGKELFLLTNSGFDFMNKGMCHMLGDDWMDLFKVVVTKSQKPTFYQQSYRPFRLLDENGKKTWGKVQNFETGKVYAEGNVETFMELLGFKSREVLYFGDHILNDLVGPVINPGWRTGAIMADLEHEISVMNQDSFRKKSKQLSLIHPYIQQIQLYMGANPEGPKYEEAKKLLEESEGKREQLRGKLKDAINPRFGSVFRSFGSSSFFNRRLIRFADIYSSRVENLLHYPIDVTIYQR